MEQQTQWSATPLDSGRCIGFLMDPSVLVRQAGGEPATCLNWSSSPGWRGSPGSGYVNCPRPPGDRLDQTRCRSCHHCKRMFLGRIRSDQCPHAMRALLSGSKAVDDPAERCVSPHAGSTHLD